jgi:hypothetical protein
MIKWYRIRNSKCYNNHIVIIIMIIIISIKIVSKLIDDVGSEYK